MDNPDFRPFFTPKEMLSLGVFEGKYLNSTRDEYPEDWFTYAKLSDLPNPSLNYFRVKSRMPLSAWQERGWIHPQDPWGWFQWYCRYTLGRRTADDARQIARWKGMIRHERQVQLNGGGDKSKRRGQRQTCLQWARCPWPDIPTLL